MSRQGDDEPPEVFEERFRDEFLDAKDAGFQDDNVALVIFTEALNDKFAWEVAQLRPPPPSPLPQFR